MAPVLWMGLVIIIWEDDNTTLGRQESLIYYQVGGVKMARFNIET